MYVYACMYVCMHVCMYVCIFAQKYHIIMVDVLEIYKPIDIFVNGKAQCIGEDIIRLDNKELL